MTLLITHVATEAITNKTIFIVIKIQYHSNDNSSQITVSRQQAASLSRSQILQPQIKSSFKLNFRHCGGLTILFTTSTLTKYFWFWWNKKRFEVSGSIQLRWLIFLIIPNETGTLGPVDTATWKYVSDPNPC